MLIKIKKNHVFRWVLANKVRLWMIINKEVTAEEILEPNFINQIKIKTMLKIIIFKIIIITIIII